MACSISQFMVGFLFFVGLSRVRLLLSGSDACEQCLMQASVHSLALYSFTLVSLESCEMGFASWNCLFCCWWGVLAGGNELEWGAEGAEYAPSALIFMKSVV